MVIGSTRLWKQLETFINFEKSSITDVLNGQVEKNEVCFRPALTICKWQKRQNTERYLKCETSWDNDVDQNSLDYEYSLKHELLWQEIDIMNIPENFVCDVLHQSHVVVSFEVSSTWLYVNVDRNSGLWIFLKTLNVMLLLHL